MSPGVSGTCKKLSAGSGTISRLASTFALRWTTFDDARASPTEGASEASAKVGGVSGTSFATGRDETSQPLQRRTVPCDERFLLRSGPSLQLPLPLQAVRSIG